MADVNSILSRLISSLTVSDPTWDVSVGSATYKILESVANEIAVTSNNNTLQTYSFDVMSKTGTQLDAFVNIFGMTRQLGKRSTGTVTFQLSSPATTIISIPLGTQVYVPYTSSATGNNIYFSTTLPASIAVGQTEVAVPIVSTLPGSFNNVDLETINTVLTPIVGLPSVINYQPLANGIDTETDAQLQARWLNTAFSNISGTTDKFTAVALQDTNITQINTIGAQQNYLEQIPVQTKIVGSGTYFIGLNFQAQLTATSGSTTASLVTGSFPQNISVTSGSYTVTPSGAYTGTITNNGTSYNLSSTITASSGVTFIVNYTSTSGTFNGTTASGTVAAVVSGLFGSLGYSSFQVTVSGSPVASGVTIGLTQATGFNVVVTNVSGTASGINTIVSQNPDAKYTYPAGGEAIGLNVTYLNPVLLNNNIDYIYPTVASGSTNGAGVPLTIPLIPNTGNAPLTYTGNYLQLQSEYIPNSSRITNPTTNSNYVDIFINASTANSVTEQIIFQPAVTLNGISGSPYYAGNFNFSSGQNTLLNTPLPTASGDYYIGFSNNPVVNFPSQVVSGNNPSFITFATPSTGNITIPVALKYVNYTGLLPIITAVSGLSGSNVLTTNTSISGLLTGLVVSGTGIGSPSTTLSGIPFGSYITQLVPGSPNQIFLNNTLTGNVNSSTLTFVTVGYPVYDNTNNAGSILDATGIMIDSNEQVGYRALNVPPFTGVNMVGTVSNAYNNDVVQVNDLEQQSRVIGTNILVRQAQYLNLTVNLSIIYGQAINTTTLYNSIQSTVEQYLASIAYTGSVSFSGIANAVLGIYGVAAVRISTATDNPTNYGITSVAIDGTKIKTYTSDILLANNQLAALYSLNITPFGINNF